MANSYIGKDDWGEESNSSPSTVEQTKASVSRGSWENEKVLEGENKLEQLRRNLVDIQDLQDDFKKSASELHDTTKETKLMTRDMLQAVPQVKKIGENLMALTKVIKNDFTNVPLSVSQESYDTVEDKLNGRVNSVLDAAVDRCADRINTKINEGISEGKQKADKVEKHLEEIFEKFTEKITADAQARLDLLQKKIDKKDEQIKQLEQKGCRICIFVSCCCLGILDSCKARRCSFLGRCTSLYRLDIEFVVLRTQIWMERIGMAMGTYSW